MIRDQQFPVVASKSTMISPQETGEPTIRDPQSADEADWRVLWSGYCAFYQTEVPEAVTAATWERMLAAGSPLFGRIAAWDGQVAGFAISVVHEGSWAIRPYCYLEDLFVAPDFRGRGIARALIEDLLQLCSQRGWSRALLAYAELEQRSPAPATIVSRQRRLRPLPHDSSTDPP
jgi:GNAT superfamily N-acetyltransferase